MSEPLRIVFMGTPDFAVPSLEAIHKSCHQLCAVVTVPDRKSGRGLQLTSSPVKKYAVDNLLPVLEPEKLRDENFINLLKEFNADLFIVVAFRMLPEAVWKLPKYGTINLHASLLPQYRGAAPINWAIINGEKESGLTTFFINDHIDKGNIIHQLKMSISDSENAGSLHDRMMIRGSELLLQTISGISEGKITTVDQTTLYNNSSTLKSAPKLSRELCRINTDVDVLTANNLVRGLSPYPGAWTEFVSPEGVKHYAKILSASPDISIHSFKTGALICDGKKHLKIALIDGFLSLESIQLTSRKALSAAALLCSFPISDGWYV
ncbi:MAG: methionyl-tRNA formyltransferase [Bacteroidota bacterium]